MSGEIMFINIKQQDISKSVTQISVLKGLSIQRHFEFKFKIKLVYSSHLCVFIP